MLFLNFVFRLFLLMVVAFFSSGATVWAQGEDVIAPGTYVIYVSGEGSQRAIMGVDPSGGMPVLLADLAGQVDTQPAVGPQGQLAWIRENGSKWELVEEGLVVSSGALHLAPAFTPEGVLAASVSEEDETSIYMFKKGQARTLLIPGGRGGLVVSPAFSPDGGRVAYVSNESDVAQIYVHDLSDGSTKVLTTAPVHNTDPNWSPNGEQIAFVTADTEICLIRPDGKGLKQLTRTQGTNRDPYFSPDGQKIVFTSDRLGTSQLFVMNVDGSGQRPLLPGLAGLQSQPVWASFLPKPHLGQ